MFICASILLESQLSFSLSLQMLTGCTIPFLHYDRSQMPWGVLFSSGRIRYGLPQFSFRRKSHGEATERGSVDL